MNKLETARFVLLLPSGDLVGTELPIQFSGRDLAERMTHVEVFAQIPRRRVLLQAYVGGRRTRLEGPAAAWWSRDVGGWVGVPRIPETEPDAVRILAEATESIMKAKE